MFCCLRACGALLLVAVAVTPKRQDYRCVELAPRPSCTLCELHVRECLADDALDAGKTHRRPHCKARLHGARRIELLVKAPGVCHEAYACAHAFGASAEAHMADEHRDLAAVEHRPLWDVALDAHPAATEADRTRGRGFIGGAQLFLEDSLQPLLLTRAQSPEQLRLIGFTSDSAPKATGQLACLLRVERHAGAHRDEHYARRILLQPCESFSTLLGSTAPTTTASGGTGAGGPNGGPPSTTAG
eukprot:CAMPEP_0115340844 /NCGR_PEP_ID=MMETSP0270-20121206/91361_1 /TAXON_ID=71861 /ORGANISM="Scrippsiella trochoidea, Strain CCMP3099" /LENGTH=243 /DNA_ID=CAMNT_0002762321 /DNA_START=197 /DNA_END=928 /DNA_ORIENTATION=-